MAKTDLAIKTTSTPGSTTSLLVGFRVDHARLHRFKVPIDSIKKLIRLSNKEAFNPDVLHSAHEVIKKVKKNIKQRILLELRDFPYSV